MARPVSMRVYAAGPGGSDASASVSRRYSALMHIPASRALIVLVGFAFVMLISWQVVVRAFSAYLIALADCFGGLLVGVLSGRCKRVEVVVAERVSRAVIRALTCRIWGGLAGCIALIPNNA